MNARTLITMYRTYRAVCRFAGRFGTDEDSDDEDADDSEGDDT